MDYFLPEISQGRGLSIILTSLHLAVIGGPSKLSC
jgi:hypothetical protein